MSDPIVPNGTYVVRGPGGQLTIGEMGSDITMFEPTGAPSQVWEVRSSNGGITVHNADSDLYLGSDDPEASAMMIRGTREPYVWTLSQGDDDDETTFVLSSAAARGGLVLTLSLVRIWPPRVAILPRANFSAFEWAFDPA